MLDRIIKPELRANQEFQAALIRFSIWLFAASFIGLGGMSHYYQVVETHYYWLFGTYFVIFCGLFASIIHRAAWEARRYFSVLVDISATSFAIFLTGEVISPFFLLYIWVFISQGTRYGKRHLTVASFLSVVAYGLLLTLMDGWREYTFEAFFFMLSLLLLPLYLHSLLQRLREARAEAERLNRAKSEFLSTMTHELRTPLSGITGMATLLEETPLAPDQREYVASISKAANHLGALVDDVLDMSRIESGRIVLESAPIDLGELMQGVCSSLMNQARAKKLELVCQLDQQLPKMIQGDELRLRQILFNLMGNAIKFTPKGEVLLRARLLAKEGRDIHPYLYIEVIDTGIGIPEHALTTLFERFSQVDASTTRRFGGTGLGTSIAQHLTHLMGGEIGVRSKLGSGSCFWVKLPLLRSGVEAQKPQYPALEGLNAVVFEPNAVSLAAIVDACKGAGIQCCSARTVEGLQDAVAAANQQCVDLLIIADSPQGEDLTEAAALACGLSRPDLPTLYLGYSYRQTHYEVPPEQLLIKPFIPKQLYARVDQMMDSKAPDRPMQQSGSAVAGAKGIHILVAEDNEINAKVLETILSNSGYQVTRAKDGQEALELTEHNHYQIAFIDLHMPRLDGLGFVRAYRANETDTPPMPVIALSVTVSDETKSECLAAGMDAVATKPIMADELVRLIQSHLCRGPAELKQ
ncbi:MAG: ATP-binding protein [Candidatus Polarisedimenticolaceae bacterium]|nr:ATP-binding protein [Candidatus Polarisedimenticolaceae bacterium]